MLGAKIYIDFTKYDFEECTSRLRKELSNIRNENDKREKKIEEVHQISNKIEEDIVIVEDTIIDTKIFINSVKEKNENAYYWTEAEVGNWLNEKKIKTSIIENIAPCDGKLLQQLYQISKEVPEFFYSSLRADSKASLKDVAFFTSELKSLFIKN